MSAVAKGAKLANDTASRLESVSENAVVIADMVGKIATNANEQSVSIAQVSVGIDQISSVTQTTSATSEESAAASEQLSGQAQMLKDLVGRFQLTQNEPFRPAPSHSFADETRPTTNESVTPAPKATSYDSYDVPDSYSKPFVPHSSQKY